jgi:cytochrome c oxidase subunit II
MAATAAAALVAAGCGGVQSALGPAGPGASRIADLVWIMLIGTIVPAALVIALILYAVFRGMRGGGGPRMSDTRVIVLGGAVFPGVILVAFSVLSARFSAEVATSPSPAAFTIEVTGHQFWWEVRYPDHGFATANEIHVPVGQSVRLVLRASDVIHSFWVPRLHGKMDLTPGRTTQWWMKATEPGEFRGQCAEYCGRQHALMAFWVIAEPPAEFEAWVAHQRQEPPAPVDPEAERGRRVFFDAGCAHCHAIQGTNVPRFTGSVGPDLTHLGSRRMLAAATIPNTPETLRRFVMDPHVFKPGVRMPATDLPAEQLDALLRYLATLQ